MADIYGNTPNQSAQIARKSAVEAEFAAGQAQQSMRTTCRKAKEVEDIYIQLTTNKQAYVGPQGPPGSQGPQGVPGISAYQLAVQEGFIGTEQEWLESLVGPQGEQGVQGVKGDTGATGLSAYQIAVQEGYAGTEESWVESLKGEPGSDATVTGGNGIKVTSGSVAWNIRSDHSGFEFTSTGAAYINTASSTHPTTGTTPGVGTDSAGMLCVPDGVTQEQLSTHVDNTLIHLTEEDVEAALTSSTATKTLSTPTATDNATCNYCVLAAGYSLNGLLTEISYKVGSSQGTGMTTNPIYCVVSELQEGSTTQWDVVGVSTNAVTQSVNATLTWTFDSLQLHGRAIKIMPTTDPTNTTTASVNMRIRVTASTDGSMAYYNGTGSAFIPRMDLVYIYAVSRFASSSDFSALSTEVSNHVADTAIHLNEEQQGMLSTFEWDTTYGLSVVHRTNGTVDGRLRIMPNTGSVALVSGYAVTMQADQFGVLTGTEFHTFTARSSDGQSYTSYNFGGHTLSDTLMAPYGITAPSTWVGEPTLPMLIRGSVISMNGTSIDVAKLASLLNNADALIALLTQEESSTEESSTEESSAEESSTEESSVEESSTEESATEESVIEESSVEESSVEEPSAEESSTEESSVEESSEEESSDQVISQE